MQLGEIDPNFQTETIRTKIGDEQIDDATVILVLIGPTYWQRKLADRELSASFLAQNKPDARGTHLASFRATCTTISIPGSPRFLDETKTPLVPDAG